MVNQGDEDDATGAAADDDPDGVGLTIPVPSMVKPWNPPPPKAPPKNPASDEPKKPDEPSEDGTNEEAP